MALFIIGFIKGFFIIMLIEITSLKTKWIFFSSLFLVIAYTYKSSGVQLDTSIFKLDIEDLGLIIGIISSIIFVEKFNIKKRLNKN